MSEERDKAAAAMTEALANAQAEMSNPHFDCENPHFKSKYASLAAVRNAVIPVAAKHGIAVVQELRSGEGTVECFTHLYGHSGHLTFGPLSIPADKQSAQGYVSAATYAKRAMLQAVLACGDEDDDGNEATKTAPKKPAPKKPAGKAKPYLLALADRSKKAGFKDRAELVNALREADVINEVMQFDDISESITDSLFENWDGFLKQSGKGE